MYIFGSFSLYHLQVTTIYAVTQFCVQGISGSFDYGLIRRPDNTFERTSTITIEDEENILVARDQRGIHQLRWKSASGFRCLMIERNKHERRVRFLSKAKRGGLGIKTIIISTKESGRLSMEVHGEVYWKTQTMTATSLTLEFRVVWPLHNCILLSLYQFESLYKLKCSIFCFIFSARCFFAF